MRFNVRVECGEVQAPIVIGRHHLDAGSVASPLATSSLKRTPSRFRSP
ncbi:MAG: hypothetical protein ACHQAW_08870 [Actinomycetota bacterium]